MRERVKGILRNTPCSAPWVMLIMLVAACGAPPTTPTPTPTPTVTAAPSPAPLPSEQRTPNTVFLPAPPSPPQPLIPGLVGRYRLDIDAGERTDGLSCSSVPDSATRRSYTADIVDLGDRYAVKLYDAAFLADHSLVSYGCGDVRLPLAGYPACHQFMLTGDAGGITITSRAEDEWRGLEVWEALPDGFLIVIGGRATGAVRDGRIEATGTGSLWYGNGLPASTYYGCKVNALRYTFTLR
jgi:hypothetical protein